MSKSAPESTSEAIFDPRVLPDYGWYESGQSALSGSLLELYRRIDNMFLRWASECQAAEFFFPTFISAHELAKLDYFRSFPHLVTFPASLDAADDNLKRFTEGTPLDQQGCVHLTALDPVKTEMVFRTGLAIGSVNFHRNYFGEASQIQRQEQEAFSGCVAFGIERWIFAFLNQFGPDRKQWPDLNIF